MILCCRQGNLSVFQRWATNKVLYASVIIRFMRRIEGKDIRNTSRIAFMNFCKLTNRAFLRSLTSSPEPFKKYIIQVTCNDNSFIYHVVSFYFKRRALVLLIRNQELLFGKMVVSYYHRVSCSFLTRLIFWDNIVQHSERYYQRTGAFQESYSPFHPYWSCLL